MDHFKGGVALIDGFTEEVKDFFEFGSRVRLKISGREEPVEAILWSREKTEIGGALFGPLPSERILYLDTADPEYDMNRRYIPIMERLKRVLVFEIESIQDVAEHTVEQEEDLDC